MDAYNGYHDYEQLSAYVSQTQAAYPQIARKFTIGKSVQVSCGITVSHTLMITHEKDTSHLLYIANDAYRFADVMLARVCACACVQNRELWGIRLTGNIAANEPKPEFKCKHLFSLRFLLLKRASHLQIH